MKMTFSDLLRDVLQYDDDEFMSISAQAPGGEFRSAVVPAYEAVARVAALGGDVNVYHGVNPVRQRETGRGTAMDTTRLAAVWADLDVKSSGCGSVENARAIIDDLSAIMGTPPMAVVNSGGGLHPYWPITGGEITDNGSRFRASATLRRFGALVRRVAGERGGHVDSVFDLPRVLRTPDTYNLKDADKPRAVTAEWGAGAVLTLTQLAAILDGEGIAADSAIKAATAAAPRTTPTATPRELVWAEETCAYATTVIKGWPGDVPLEGRHQWLVYQAVRLVSMHRRGCVTEESYEQGKAAITDRFTVLCTEGINGDPRAVQPSEVADALAFADVRVGTMSDADVEAELGTHLHDAELCAVTVTTAPPADPHRDPVHADDEDDDDFSGLVGDAAEPQTSKHVISMTDSGIADLLVAQNSNRLRYCPQMGKWLSWDGIIWGAQADDSPAYQAARETVESIQLNGTGAVAKFKNKCLSASSLGAMTGLARRQADLQVTMEMLDANPYYINTQSGVVDLVSGSVVRGWAGFHTKVTGVGFDPLLPRPLWDEFLLTTFGGDSEMIGYVQRLAGLTAIGEVREEILPFLHGVGKNGKTVFLDTLLAVLGDYAQAAPTNFLLHGRSEKHETEIARLRGARLVVASEVNQGSKFDEAKVKVLTGGDTLTGRFLHKDFFDFVPSHSIWLMGNHQPSVEAGGISFWRRLRLIPFEHVVPESKRVKGLKGLMVRNEGAAILAWIVEGAQNYLRFGLVDPPRVTEATAEYARSEDHLGRFAEECLVVGMQESDRVPSSTVMITYRLWCKENGEVEMPERQLGRELGMRFKIGTARGSGGQRLRTRLALTPDAMPSFLLDGRA
jgi:P4 family phage/plasmid primase-like protien